MAAELLQITAAIPPPFSGSGLFRPRLQEIEGDSLIAFRPKTIVPDHNRVAGQDKGFTVPNLEEIYPWDLAEEAMAERIKRAVEDLRGVGTTLVGS